MEREIIPKKLNKNAFEVLCQAYVREPLKRALRERRFRMTSHFLDRMSSRGTSLNDVSCAVFSGKVKSSVWCEKRRNWKCKVQGVDGRGNTLSVVAAIGHKSGIVQLLTLF